MPDGTVIRNVPEGTTQAELTRRYAAHTASAPAQPPTPGAEPGERSASVGGRMLSDVNEAGIHFLSMIGDAVANAANLTGAAGSVAKRELFGPKADPYGGRPAGDLYEPMMTPSEAFTDIGRRAGVLAPPPATTGEQLQSAITQAGVGAALGRGVPVPGGAAPTLGQVGRAAGGGALSGAAAGAVGAAGGTPQQQVLASMLPTAARPAARGLVQEPIRRALVGNTDVKGRIQTAREAGITNPDPAAVTGSRALGMAEGTLARLPGGGSTMDAAAEARAKGMQGRAEQVARGLRPQGAVSSERAGREIVAGVTGDIGRMQGVQKGLYDKLDAIVPPDQPIQLTNFLAAAKKFGTAAQGMEEFSGQIVPPKVSGIAAAADQLTQRTGGAAPYKGVSQLRTQLGTLFEGGAVPEGLSRGQAKSLYGALSRDIEASLPPEAKPAWSRASHYTRAMHDRIETVYEPLLDKGTFEKATTAAFSGTKEGASAFRKVMGSLTPDQRSAVGAHVIEKMGRATASQQTAEGDRFSIETFLTNYGKLDPAARKALYPSPQTLKDVETLAKAASDMREAGRGTHNPSGTARAVTHAGFAGAGVSTVLTSLLTGHPGVALGTAGALGAEVAANRSLARAMTSPEFVHWLAEGTKRPEVNLPSYAARLNAIAASTRDPDTRQAIEDVAAQLAPGGQSK